MCSSDLTLVKNDPRYDYRVKQCDDKACIIEWFESGALRGQAGFTMAEALAAGLTGKDNWKKYPSDMLFARAISRGARRFAPGIFGGSPVYTPDEMGVEVDEDGAVVIEAEVKPIDGSAQPIPEISEPEVILAELGFDVEPPANGKMGLESAMSVKNSKGEAYGGLDTDTLSFMANSINKKLKMTDLPQDKRDTYEYKRDAIAVILASRQPA